MSLKLKTWKTIKLGTGLIRPSDFRKAIEWNRMDISEWADNILSSPEFTVAAREIEVDLVKLTVAQLGFKKTARGYQIYKKIKGLGLGFCPSELGPQLRLQYHDQPEGEWIIIGMDPIRNSNGILDVFYLTNDGSKLKLLSCYGGPGSIWLAEYQWVFVRPHPRKE